MPNERRPFSEIHTQNFRTPERPPKIEHLEIVSEEDGGTIYQGYDKEHFSDYIETVQGPEGREAFATVCAFAQSIQEAGGRALLVGGSVRDEVLGMASKDFDIEVYGLSPEKIEALAETFGRVDAVGKAFGILKVTTENGIDLDVSLPRTDSKVGDGHRGFIVEADPNMSIKEAAKRRDFSFNALAKDPLTGEIFDYFGGVHDLETRTLRVTDETLFKDDPLRILRGAQFVGRFGMQVEPKSAEIMRGMVDRLAELPKERIKEEWDKLLLRADRPSMGLQMLYDIGVIEKHYPELADLKPTPQDSEWHPEGDVWVHTLMVADAAASVVDRHQVTGQAARTVMYGALCHDLGKPSTTTIGEDGHIRSMAHEPKGDAPTRALLERLGQPQKSIDAVVNVVRLHLWPSITYFGDQKGEKVRDGSFRRLAKNLSPATIEELTYVSEADHIGRGPFADPQEQDQFLLPEAYAAGKWLRDRAEELGIYREVAPPTVRGRELIKLGFKPGAEFRIIMDLADNLRDEKNFTQEMVLEQMSGAKTSAEAIEKLQAAM